VAFELAAHLVKFLLAPNETIESRWHRPPCRTGRERRDRNVLAVPGCAYELGSTFVGEPERLCEVASRGWTRVTANTPLQVLNTTLAQPCATTQFILREPGRQSMGAQK
jgi:hypothetical protein